jgi:hypothetical protein
MNNYTETEINHILESYKKIKNTNKKYYDKIKDTDEFKKKNRERAKKHYHENKEYKKTKRDDYEKNKAFLNARSSCKYYEKKNRLDEFIEKFPEKYEIVMNHFNSQNPPLPLTGTTSSSSPDE